MTFLECPGSPLSLPLRSLLSDSIRGQRLCSQQNPLPCLFWWPWKMVVGQVVLCIPSDCPLLHFQGSRCLRRTFHCYNLS